MSTAEQLAYIDENQSLYLSRHIQLMNDIDMSGYHWIPFGGNGEERFSGIFDGNGYRVSGIHIPLTSLQYVGFFGQSSGIVKNLGIAVDIEGGTFNSDGSTTTGGMIGELYGGSIDRSYVHGKVVGVNATSGFGAISSITGGLVGESQYSTITNSSSTATVIAGIGPNTISGGLVGAQGAGTISDVYARGEVMNQADKFVDVGGVIGFMVSGTIDKGYGTGKVSLQGSRYQGGFAGSLFVKTNIWKSYFDSETTGQSNGIGFFYEGATEAFGKATDEMKQQSTYSDWDFVHTWAIHPGVNDGYPFLRPAILTTALPNGDKDIPYSSKLTAFDGASGGLTWQADGLPAGISLSSNGLLQGTPRQSGSFNIEFTVKDAGDAQAAAMLQLVIKEPAPDIQGFKLEPGSAIGTTIVTAEPGQTGHTFAYVLSNHGNARPLVGDVLPAEAAMYTLGLDIPNVHAGQYLEVYETDGQFLIQAWYTVQLTDAHIKSGAALQWPDGSRLAISDITQTSVKLSWPMATDNAGVSGYRIHVNDVERRTVSASTHEAIMNELTANKTYTFKVTAFDAEGNEGEALSNQATTARSSAGGGYPLSNNADLMDLQVWGEVGQLKLSPSFSSETAEYTARTEAEQVEIAAIQSHVMANVTLGDNVMTDKVKVNLIEGDNKFVLTVHAENGAKREYILIIHRELAKPTAPLIELTDIAGHWAESYIEQAVSQGIIIGFPDRKFKPDDAVTRAEFTVMLAAALNLNEQGAAPGFTDDDQIGQWAKQAVSLALKAGIVDGYKDGSFRPDVQITRTEMASMIAKALNVPRNTGATTGFADDKDIPIWAKDDVEALRKLGIANGRGGNAFVPNDTATRSEAVAILLKMLEIKERK
ncbi:S-layer homology domain-containing protein [Paenibacillus pinisoli]|uniref:S-layer homology domain-containing protein n=1 Tax=Paenibacillus pinisoli TaxID=1276110 RepID=UPI0014021369|nr:S-layer homology domain-containing protein [Paenibacillus pinisoli]